MGTLLTQVEAFCRDNNLTEAKFGKLALNDNKFVSQLREQRDLRLSTVQRVKDFMATYRREAA